MNINGWKYYNHAVIPTCAPHVVPDISLLDSGKIWKVGGGIPLLARWTTDWDCGHETDWWYVIKDEPFDISSIKSDKRYKINKGKRYFEIRVINPIEYAESLYEVNEKAIRSYPSKNQVHSSYDEYFKRVQAWHNDDAIKIYAAFFKETNELCGYILGMFHNDYFSLSSQKADPVYEKYQINAALVEYFLMDNAELLSKGIYCNDGERSISHETNFQTYLIRYFGFRKAYCKLNITYRVGVRFVVKILYPFRKHIKGFLRVTNQISGVLKMEEIIKQQEVKIE